jgi:hypothetical protein
LFAHLEIMQPRHSSPWDDQTTSILRDCIVALLWQGEFNANLDGITDGHEEAERYRETTRKHEFERNRKYLYTGAAVYWNYILMQIPRGSTFLIIWKVLLASSILRRNSNALVRSSIIPWPQMQTLTSSLGRHRPPLGLLKRF